MQLFYRKLGKGMPFIILHGLYGSSDNWISVARELSVNLEVWLIDLRNHGRSPHHKDHTYEIMVDDLYEFVNEHKLKKFVLLGHSMGGKLAMHFADSHPELLSHLIIVDIAPKSYLFSIDIQSDTLNHKQIMEGMLAMDFSGITNREEIDLHLTKLVPNDKIRHFLMKNIKRKQDMSFDWSLNIEALYLNLNNILCELKVNSKKSLEKLPVLFVKGSDSDYINKLDLEDINTIFPMAKLEIIKDAGHWLHIEKPDLLIKTIKEFIF